MRMMLRMMARLRLFEKQLKSPLLQFPFSRARIILESQGIIYVLLTLAAETILPFWRVMITGVHLTIFVSMWFFWKSTESVLCR